MSRNGHGSSSVNGPLRTVVELQRQPYGGGHIKIYKLDCGHIVTYLFRPDLTVGKLTGCPHCKEAA